MAPETRTVNAFPAIAKAQFGIRGLDEITRGGLPAGRPTLLCGGPGCGKTILAMEFLVRGAQHFGEPGLFVSFEESPRNLAQNFRSFRFDLDALAARKQLKISHVEFSRGEIVESGEFSLDGLRIRLEHGIKEIGAKRLVLDTMETIFASLANTEWLRNEMSKLFRWLADRNITTIVTGERGKDQLTRHGFEEYIADCVLLLDHRLNEQIAKRRVRVVKYRGSAHANNECPFLIGETGFSVLPITSLHLDHGASATRVSTGVADLDRMLGGQGYYKASTVLVSGRAGTGKSSLAAAFAVAACGRNERCLYFAFEESAAQLVRNMRSIGVDLQSWSDRGLLTVQADRPSFRGLEEHLMEMIQTIDRVEPAYVIVDPISDFLDAGPEAEVKTMLMHLVDYAKSMRVTLIAIALITGSGRPDETKVKVSTLVDTWIALDLEPAGHARRRELYIVKSRGMEHSQETVELVMSGDGLTLRALRHGEK